MKKIFLVVVAVFLSLAAQAATKEEIARWKQQAGNVTIIRDDWGIAHVYGKSDADAVFGAESAQAEDDFNRVETNYINAMGRMAETQGESAIYQDLRMKLFIDPADLKQKYAESPAWLKKLMNAFADGLNYYLYTHPDVKPRVIEHFEPWMALSFTEGSIGGDIERVNLRELQQFYGAGAPSAETPEQQEPQDGEATGSNGMAIAPSNTTDRHALLLINPHTSFFFRSELQMVSDEGLDAYGASTWGQFFIYQGFNTHTGWMHTSSGVDAVDEYLETITKQGDKYTYKYGSEERPVREKVITVPYRTYGGMAEKKFTVYYTTHGPIIRKQGEQWVAIKLMQEPIKQLEQSFLRTKTKDYKEYLKVMEMYANSSNNTVFADSDGDIAYFQGNYIPKRDNQFDFTKPVDGSNPSTDWHGILTIDETPHLLNPKSGWIYNSNDAPWSAAGPGSLKKSDYPAYVETGGETARGLHAVRVLENKKEFSIDGLLGAAFDSYLPWFAKTVPSLIKAWDDAPDSDPLKAKLKDQVAALRGWDYRWGVNSVPTSLAVFWGEHLYRQNREAIQASGETPYDYVSKLPEEKLLAALGAASDRLTADFGTWKTPWGEINRFQRVNDDIDSNFNDSSWSIPVGFTYSMWGSLASFAAKPYPNTKKWYGTGGNSFVAVVEFGPNVRARAVTAGGESGNPLSRHFNDEAKRYATGNLREVYYYRSQLQGHTERTYHPGE
ncbi:MAG TPA: penicillin acylase family protein [Terriglobales bacterium]|nr:penicillin acylase family protein [Terriglobales bacterium]